MYQGMKGVHIINDETQGRRYVQIELSTLKKVRQSGKSIISFLEDLEDVIDVELSRGEQGKSEKEDHQDISVEQYNKELEEADAAIDRGEFHTQDEVEIRAKAW